MGSNGEEHSLMVEEDRAEIDPKRSRFPYCIVWSPLPVLSWFFPCIGHIGICREDGVILDFAGPNFICVDSFAFGPPTRYIRLSKEQCCSLLNRDEIKIVSWDDVLGKSTREYQHQSYNILTCNCHSFVANCLNRLNFEAGNWNVVNLALLILIKGRFVSKLAILQTYSPFVVVFGFGLALGGQTFLTCLAIFDFLLVGWFLVATYCIRKLVYV
ncbi:hypothetical protein CASFOL_012100 [Castilleja foliolosa]|uniref:Uncharacterized protein n=1 Tax=Castilleja foliolosa TaxID=1961234 RepID=A0ABD3DPE4_9LAMI